MRVDFTSSQEFDMDGATATLLFDLECIVCSYPGSFNLFDGGNPPEGPEFELVSISLVDHEGKHHDISEKLVIALIGAEGFNYMYEQACINATEERDF